MWRKIGANGSDESGDEEIAKWRCSASFQIANLESNRSQNLESNGSVKRVEDRDQDRE